MNSKSIKEIITIKQLTEKQQKTYDLLSSFAINNSLPFSIKAYEIGEQCGYKVVQGEKEGYERCCSGAESCMKALKERELIDFDIRRHTGFIVKNVKVTIDFHNNIRQITSIQGGDSIALRGWLKRFDNHSADFEEHQYEYELSDVIKFNKDLLSSGNQSVDIASTDLGKRIGELYDKIKEEQPAKEDSVKIKINEEPIESSPEPENVDSDSVWEDVKRAIGIDNFYPNELSVMERLTTLEDWQSKVRSVIQQKVVTSDIILSSLAILEEWKKETESELILLSSRIDVLENGNEENVESVKEEAGKPITIYERDELAKSRPYVESMMYLSRFFKSGVRIDNKQEPTYPHLCEFSKVSAAINNNVKLRVDSFKHKDIHVAEMSGAIVVVLSARDNPKFFVSMNKEEKELYNQCSEMFNEFNKNDFHFHSDAYCETSHWNIKREQKSAASFSPVFFCSECLRHFDELKKLKIPIQVHHINDASYSRIFRENLEDLEVLCKECHGKKHSKTSEDKDEIGS